MKRLLALAVILPALAGSGAFAQAKAPAAPSGGGNFIPLDHVVAVINGDVLLESDVDQEMHFAVLEPFSPAAGKDTRLDAMRRLIDRTLIVQQMKEQRQFNINISDAEVTESLDDLRARLPQCTKYHCKTEAGWKAFLAANDLTESGLKQHWKQRMVILRFIDVRFESGIRISHESIQDYYAKTVVPLFAKQNETAPALKSVSGRIEQVLLEQQVNNMLLDWLKSLREGGDVRIVDQAYAALEGNPKGEEQSE